MDKSARDNKTIDLKLLQWWERHPLKIIGVALCLALAATILFFLFVYVPNQLRDLQRQLGECQAAKAGAEARIPVPPTDPNALDSTPAQIGEQFRARQDRDAEQASFARSLAGKNIHWEVEVSSLSGGGYLHFRPPGGGASNPVTMAVFYGETAKRADSLHPGDLIRLHGTLEFLNENLVNVTKASFEFLHGKDATLKKSE